MPRVRVIVSDDRSWWARFVHRITGQEAEVRAKMEAEARRNAARLHRAKYPDCPTCAGRLERVETDEGDLYICRGIQTAEEAETYGINWHFDLDMHRPYPVPACGKSFRGSDYGKTWE